MCCDRLRMNMEILRGHMELVESYMSNGQQKLLLIWTWLYLGWRAHNMMHRIQLQVI